MGFFGGLIVLIGIGFYVVVPLWFRVKGRELDKKRGYQKGLGKQILAWKFFGIIFIVYAILYFIFDIIPSIFS